MLLDQRHGLGVGVEPRLGLRLRGPLLFHSARTASTARPLPLGGGTRGAHRVRGGRPPAPWPGVSRPPCAARPPLGAPPPPPPGGGPRGRRGGARGGRGESLGLGCFGVWAGGGGGGPPPGAGGGGWGGGGAGGAWGGGGVFKTGPGGRGGGATRHASSAAVRVRC